MPSDLNVLHSPGGEFTVLVHNVSGAWKIVEGNHSIEAVLPLAKGMDAVGTAREYRVITIFLNNSCNLRCDYCRFEAVTHHAREHGHRELQKVVEAVRNVSRAGEHVEIHFQGGEPLLRATDIAWVCNALRAEDIDFHPHFHVTTNGTVNTPRALSVLEEHAISVTISIDGTPDVHDAHRVFPDGSGSFDRVVETMEMFRARGIRFGVFCVVSDPAKMTEMHDYLVDVLGLTTFVLAPLEIDGEDTAEALEQYLESFFAAQLGLLERNINRFLAGGTRVREHLGELLLRGKIEPSFFSKACGDSPRSTCGTRMHSIERNGDILPCQNSRMSAGEGTAYLGECLSRLGLCETCEIRGHCSTPVCFTRMSPSTVRGFRSGDAEARTYVGAACTQLKRREMALFDLFYRRKKDVLAYLAG